ncbi:MAG: peptidylprolyl isomerase, partial [Shewanella sp.]
LSNQPGTIAMARSLDPHSATSQFFFNVADNSRLDPSPKRWGYAVFGEVVSGMEVIDAIAKVETGQQRTLNWQDVPLQPVLLKKATLLSDK